MENQNDTMGGDSLGGLGQEDKAVKALSAALIAAARLRSSADVISKAFEEAYPDGGRYDGGQMALELMSACAKVLDQYLADHSDLADRYAEEAEDEESEFATDDALSWSDNHGKACEAFGVAQRDLLRIAEEMKAKLYGLDI